MPQQFIVLYGGAVGASGRLNPDSAARCNTALRVVHSWPMPYIIFTADDTIPSLRRATLEYLEAIGWPLHRVIGPLAAHDTMGETKAGFQVLREMDMHRVIIMSTWYHLPRIWAMWRYLGFDGGISFKWSWRTKNLLMAILWEAAGFAKFLKNIVTVQV